MGSSIRFVSYRPRSKKEIRDFLAGKLKRGHITAPLVVEQILKRLTDLGYIDDVKFTEWWVSQRTAFKPKGKRALELELHKKGIDQPDIIIDERPMALSAAAKKIKSVGRLPREAQKRKLADHLMRRGFSSEVVWSVVDDIIATV